MTTDTTLHDQIRSDLAGYALGALDDAGDARVTAHLAACAECRVLLREYEEVVRLLPLGLPATQPSPSARADLLRRARADRGPHATQPVLLWLDRRGRQLAAVAAILCLLLAGVLGWAVARDDGDPGTAAAIERMKQQAGVRVFPMVGSEAAPAALGQLIVVPGERDAGLIVSGLPRLPEGYDYQFWFVMPDTRRISGGVFEVDATGEAIVTVNAPAEFSAGWRCGVTEEPDGGSPSPTGRNVLRAAYDDSYYVEGWE